MNLTRPKESIISSSAGSHVLLVEDQTLIAVAERHHLESSGFRVTVASTGEQAVELIRSDESIQIVLMDIDLGPGIDGIEAAEQILASHAVPIVFVTTHTEPETVQRTESIAAYGYVVKDNGPVVLLACAKAALRVHQIDRAAQHHCDDLMAMMNQSPVGMVLIGEDWGVRHANRAALSIAGRTPDILTGAAVSTNQAEAQRFGDILGCVNRHEAPGGCGTTPVCPDCPAYGAVTAVLASGRTVLQEIGSFRIDRNGGGESPRDTSIRFSTACLSRDGHRAALIVLEEMRSPRGEPVTA